MSKKTATANRIFTAGANADKDGPCKQIFASKEVLARILKECVEEFKDCSLEDIAYKYIEGEPQISSVTLHQDEVMPEFIEGRNSEDKTICEGLITYDIVFDAIVPNGTNKIRLIIDIEPQNKDGCKGGLSYELSTRGVYYCCRLISRQKEKIFSGSNYQDIRKVYSIWIDLHPKAGNNTITKISLKSENIVGDFQESCQNYDLISVVTIRLGDYNKSEGVIKLLNTLIAKDMSTDEKIRCFENNLGMKMTNNLKEEVSNMCNWSELYKQQGIEQGENRAERRIAANLLKSGKMTIEEIAEVSGLTVEQVDSLESISTDNIA